MSYTEYVNKLEKLDYRVTRKDLIIDLLYTKGVMTLEDWNIINDLYIDNFID